MSRGGSSYPSGERRFPRVSGDEPATPEALMTATTFSPRERG